MNWNEILRESSGHTTVQRNMSLNSYVTPDDGEIGRAQAMETEAAGIESTVEMNSVLLKPQADSRSRVIFIWSALPIHAG